MPPAPLARRALLCWLPAALAAAHALWAFSPQREGLIGFGDDPAFNAWHFLHLFRALDAHGPLAILGREIWNAPIFAPGELHLALSENQLAPGLLLWPIWRLTGQLVPTLDLGMAALGLAAFASAAGWLGARGVGELRFWGGLVFSACGFLQVHYAHWQNGCVFLVPLALWAWERLRQEPSAPRALLCGAAFGWMIAWNIYYWLLGMALLGGLLAWALLTRALPRRMLLVAAAAALLVGFPLLLRYAELGRRVGGYGAWEHYPAHWLSFLERPMRPSWLEAHLGFWPRRPDLGIESAGFTGFAWLLLGLAAVTRRRARWPLFGAALAYWASFGPGYGLYDLLRAAPGFSGIRAVGRLQLGATVGLLAAAFTLLEDLRGWRRWLPIALVLLELAPAGPALRVRIPAAIDGPPTPLEQALAGDRSPVLALDGVPSLVQLAVLRSGAPLYGGYSGRSPATGDLLFDRAVRRRAPLGELLDLTGATRLLTTDRCRAEEARRSPRVRERGCHDALGSGACLFDVVQPPPDGPRVRMDRDLIARVVPLADGAALELLATAGGLLDFGAIDRCRVVRQLAFPLLPALEHDVGLEGRSFAGTRFEPGQLVYRKELRGPWLRWPAWLRPRVGARLVCE